MEHEHIDKVSLIRAEQKALRKQHMNLKVSATEYDGESIVDRRSQSFLNNNSMMTIKSSQINNMHQRDSEKRGSMLERFNLERTPKAAR